MEKFGVGGEIDRAYWAENNPATIALTAPEPLRRLAIYIEAGSEDSLELHRVLWDNEIKHEYRRIPGADDIGDSLEGRLRYAFAFIGWQWHPPPEDQAVKELRRAIAPARIAAGLPPG